LKQAIEDGLLKDLRANQRPGSTETYKLRLRKGCLPEAEDHRRRSALPTPAVFARRWRRDQKYPCFSPSVPPENAGQRDRAGKGRNDGGY
jgi:hypothetical protein